MNRRIMIVVLLAVAAGLVPLTVATAQQAVDESQPLAAGRNYIPTPVYSAEDDAELLELYSGLRVADVIDGMDMVGLRGIGSMDPEIHPLWKNIETFGHRIIGIAVTVRYVPSNAPAMGPMDPADFDEWVQYGYDNITSEPFGPLLREGSVLVMDETPSNNVGSVGSNNILAMVRAGMVGLISNGTGVRDTDEIIAQGIPVYYRHPGRGIRPGRNIVESVNRPVVVGGALVIPGDVIVADGDGVIVVPRAQARDVALYAKGVLDGDKNSRRQQYEQMGMELDESVK